MKILFVLPEYYPHSGGGISTYYLHYIKALKSEVDEICVIIGSGYTQSDEVFKINGIKVEYLKPAIYKSYLHKFGKFDLTPEYRNNMAASWAMYEQSNKGANFDIIECTDFGLGFVPWLSTQKKPVIVRLHGSSGQIDLFETKFKVGLSADLIRQTELILLSYADKLISHSTANKNYWQNLFQNKSVELIYPIYNNIQNNVPFEMKDNYGIVCGRVQDWKGPDILCKAMELLNDENPLIKWYGRDTSFDGKIQKTAQLKTDFPKVWGVSILHQQPLLNSEITEVQRKASFAIIPSTWDMFNFTGLEYMSIGTIVICSDGAGVSELIIDGKNGFKYNKYDYKSLAKCIQKVTSLNVNDYNKIVENAKKTFLTTLEEHKIIKDNLSLYSSVMAHFKPTDSNTFIEALYYPTNSLNKIDNILDKQPLKALLKYVFRRLLRKINS